jgi:hypothetical protein
MSKKKIILNTPEKEISICLAPISLLTNLPILGSDITIPLIVQTKNLEIILYFPIFLILHPNALICPVSFTFRVYFILCFIRTVGTLA